MRSIQDITAKQRTKALLLSVTPDGNLGIIPGILSIQVAQPIYAH